MADVVNWYDKIPNDNTLPSQIKYRDVPVEMVMMKVRWVQV